MSRKKLKCGCVKYYNNNTRSVRLGFELSNNWVVEFFEKHKIKLTNVGTKGHIDWGNNETN
jgi:hypothetical protein